MAQLNDLVVNGNTRFLNSAYGNLVGSASTALNAGTATNADKGKNGNSYSNFGSLAFASTTTATTATNADKGKNGNSYSDFGSLAFTSAADRIKYSTWTDGKEYKLIGMQTDVNPNLVSLNSFIKTYHDASNGYLFMLVNANGTSQYADRGIIRLANGHATGTTAGYALIQPNYNHTGSISVTLPAANGILARLDDLPNTTSIGGTGGTAGWVNFADIKITGAYANYGIDIELTSRGQAPVHIHILFNSVNSLIPSLQQIFWIHEGIITGTNGYAYSISDTTGDNPQRTLHLWHLKNEAYGEARYKVNAYNQDKFSITKGTLSQINGTALPSTLTSISEYVYATKTGSFPDLSAGYAAGVKWEAGTDAVYRPIPFAWGNTALWDGNATFSATLTYDQDFMYNPSTNKLQVQSVSGGIQDCNNTGYNVYFQWSSPDIKKVTPTGGATIDDSKYLAAWETGTSGSTKPIINAVDASKVTVGSAVSASTVNGYKIVIGSIGSETNTLYLI